jgi:hypothetical protein
MIAEGAGKEDDKDGSFGKKTANELTGAILGFLWSHPAACLAR